MGFPCSSVGKESAYHTGDLGSIRWSGRSPGEGNGNPFQYSCQENPMDRGAWQAIVHGVTRVRHDLATKPPPPPHLAQICRIVMPQCECQHLPSHVSGRQEPSPWYFTCMTTWPMNWSSTLRSSSNFFCLIKMCFQGNLKTC